MHVFDETKLFGTWNECIVYCDGKMIAHKLKFAVGATFKISIIQKK